MPSPSSSSIIEVAPQSTVAKKAMTIDEQEAAILLIGSSSGRSSASSIKSTVASLAEEEAAVVVVEEKRINYICGDISYVPSPLPKWAMLAASIVLLITGTYDSVAFKWQNRQLVPRCGDTNPDGSYTDECAPVYFEGPFYQTLIMYFGELLCLFVYMTDKWIQGRHGKPVGSFDCPSSPDSFYKPMCPYYWWLVPTVLDYTSSTMINYATIFTFASTVQILGSFSVLLTAILSLCYVRVALRVNHYIGIFVVTVGIILTACYSLMNPDDSTGDASKSSIGVILSLAGYTLSSFQFVFEEKLFRRYYCSPMLGVGLEGIYGTVIGIVIMIICGYAGWEDVTGCLYQTGHCANLIVSDVTIVFSVMMFNSSGLMVTKMGSGLLRSVLFSLRSCLVWLVEVCMKWNSFDGLDFAGLVLVAVGVVIYNNVLPYSCCPGFKSVMTKQLPFWCVKAEPEPEEKAAELAAAAAVVAVAEDVAIKREVEQNGDGDTDVSVV